VRRLFALCVLALVLAGCPREPRAPDPRGEACGNSEDCNGGATCGALRACVEGFCEDQRSLIRPCPGVGEPLDP
jgi:hypothetical protein